MLVKTRLIDPIEELAQSESSNVNFQGMLYLDHGDIVYDQSPNDSFIKQVESVQYNAAIAITGAIRGTSQKKLYKELDLESLKLRRKISMPIYILQNTRHRSP